MHKDLIKVNINDIILPECEDGIPLEERAHKGPQNKPPILLQNEEIKFNSAYTKVKNEDIIVPSTDRLTLKELAKRNKEVKETKVVKEVKVEKVIKVNKIVEPVKVNKNKTDKVDTEETGKVEEIKEIENNPPKFNQILRSNGAIEKIKSNTNQWAEINRLIKCIISLKINKYDLDSIYKNSFLVTTGVLNIYMYVSHLALGGKMYKGMMKNYSLYGFSYDELGLCTKYGLNFWERILSTLVDYANHRNKIVWSSIFLNNIIKQTIVIEGK